LESREEADSIKSERKEIEKTDSRGSMKLEATISRESTKGSIKTGSRLGTTGTVETKSSAVAVDNRVGATGPASEEQPPTNDTGNVTAVHSPPPTSPITITTAKFTPVHAEVLAQAASALTEYRDRYCSVAEEVARAENGWRSSEEKWREQWERSVKEVKALYKPG